MAKVGRNDPCPCGSGKKYKQCHGPIDAARQSEQRQLRQASDSLTAKVMDAAPQFADEFGGALARFWNNTHTVQDMDRLDDLEERGAERFLSWFMFDHRDDAGRTPVSRLAADPAALELTPMEATLLPTWTNVHLRPYEVTGILKGSGLVAKPLWSDDELRIEDQAAARRVETGEVLIVHLMPVGDTFLVGGAAAHLTSDAVPKLREWLDLHLEQHHATHPDATYEDMLQERSEILNHFVMALPREANASDQLQTLLDNTRVLMSTTKASLGIGSAANTEDKERS
jgi:hypothetical protein